MNALKEWHSQTIGAKVVAALEKNYFKAFYAANRDEALKKILELIPADVSVGVGGSVTLHEIGLIEELEKRGNVIYNHGKPGISKEDAAALRHQELSSDVFLTSSNAITMKGELVNVDGTGNRVAAMIFGPKTVIVVAGINKIVPDYTAAVERVKLFAAPLNNKRLNIENPCVINGKCMDCHAPSRICKVTTIMHQKPSSTEVYVFIVGEELGF